jgi:hypothetical protein
VYIAIAASRQALLKVRLPDLPDLPGQPKVAGRRWRKSMHGPPAAPEEVAPSVSRAIRRPPRRAAKRLQGSKDG